MFSSHASRTIIGVLCSFSPQVPDTEMQTKITMILQPKLSVAVVEFLLYLLELTWRNSKIGNVPQICDTLKVIFCQSFGDQDTISRCFGGFKGCRIRIGVKMCKYTHDTWKSFFVEHELNMTTLTKFVCTTDVKYLSHTQGLTKGLSDKLVPAAPLAQRGGVSDIYFTSLWVCDEHST